MEGALTRLTRSITPEAVIAPTSAISSLSREERLLRQRRRATNLLEEATLLVHGMRYQEALPKLELAETLAAEGLAYLIDPKLPADIHFQWGIALLPRDAAASQRHLIQSFTHWPHRSLDASSASPKLTRGVEEARQRARSTVFSPRERIAAEIARTAEILRADRVVVLNLRRTGEEERARLDFYDARTRAWRSGAQARWPATAAAATIRAALRPLLRKHLDAVPRAAGEGRGRRAAPWIAAGVGAASLIAGTTLFLVARGRLQEAESLARQTPLEEWGARAEGLESGAMQLKTGAVVSFCLAGAAALTAAALWLWWPPSPSDGGWSVSLGPGAVSLTWRR